VRERERECVCVWGGGVNHWDKFCCCHQIKCGRYDMTLENMLHADGDRVKQGGATVKVSGSNRVAQQQE
jgi:hypothetical protein